MEKQTTSIIVKADGSQAKKEFKEVGNEAEKMGHKASAAGKQGTKSFKQMDQAAAETGSKLKTVFGGMQTAGIALSSILTAPILAIGGLATKSALSMDALRTKITALVGDAAKANDKILELQALAAKSVGVTQKAALDMFAQLKGLRVDDAAINKMIASMGRLNAAFKIDDVAGFTQNLNQIFAQGFERADIKEAIGRVPFFEELLKQAFGTSDGAKLKALKDSGKMTIDSFLSGISGAIDSDPRLANIGENLTTKMSKAWEKLEVALAPVGDIILSTIVPAVEALSPYIQNLMAGFQTLSPAMQSAVVAFGAIAAAIGPVLLAIGVIGPGIMAVVEGIGLLGGVSAIASTIAAAFPPVLAVLAAVALAAGAVYLAWTTNFGGIQELTATVWAGIQEALSSAYAAILELTAEVTAQALTFWAENGENITAVFETLSGIVRSIWTGIVGFWTDNQESIKAVTSAVWAQIKTVVLGAMKIIGDIIGAVMAAINGDWAGFWSRLGSVVKTAVGVIAQILLSGGVLFKEAVILSLKAALNVTVWLWNAAIEIGKAVIMGIWNGIKSLHDLLTSAGNWIGQSIVSAVKSFLGIASPSKVFHKLGVNTVEGLIAGLREKTPDAKKQAAAIAKEVVEGYKNARDEFNKLAGASPEVVLGLGATAKLTQGRSDLDEVVKLRNQLALNLDKNLPATPAEAAQELRYLQDKAKAAEDFAKSLEEIQEGVKRAADLQKEWADKTEELKAATEAQGETSRLNLLKDIELLGVTDPMERARIDNAYDLLLAREALTKDGFGAKQIEEILAVRKVENGRLMELIKLKDLKETEIEATKKAAEEAKKAAEEYKDFVDNLAGRIEDSMGRIFDGFRGGAKSGLKSLLGEIENIFRDHLQNIFRGISQSIAQMLGKTLSGSAGPGAAGLFPGGTPPFSPGGSGLNFGGAGGQMIGASWSGGSSPIGLLGPSHEMGHAGAGAPGGSGGIAGGLSGIAAQFKSMFKPRTNILTGKTSKMGGILGGIGDIMGMVGGMVGGRVGNVLSYGGMGLSLGSMFGPWGALIGGIGGGLIGLLMGDPKRKRDKREKMPKLDQGFIDSLTEIKALVSDVRALRIDPTQAIGRATEIRAAIASGFGLQFESGKYQKISAQRIAAKLAEADALIQELRNVSDISNAAALRRQRLIPEFAGGGLPVPGQVALVGERGPELFVPNVGGRVISNQETQNILGGSTNGGQPVTIPITLSIDREGLVKGYAESPDGRRVLVDIVANAYKNDELKLKRRGM